MNTFRLAFRYLFAENPLHFAHSSIKVQLCADFSYAFKKGKCDQSHSRQLYAEFMCEFIFTQRDNRHKVAKAPLSNFMRTLIFCKFAFSCCDLFLGKTWIIILSNYHTWIIIMLIESNNCVNYLVITSRAMVVSKKLDSQV